MGPALIHWLQWMWRIEFWKKKNILGDLGKGDTRSPGTLQPLKVTTAPPKDGIVLKGSTMLSPGLGVMLIPKVHLGRGWPSVEQRSTYTLLAGVVYLADTASRGAEIYLRAGKQTNPQQALQPFLHFSCHCFPHSHPQAATAASGMVAEASVGVCTAWGKDQELSGRKPVLLSSYFGAQGRGAKLQGTWQELGPAP